eukprot:5874133-Pleurochrysis_carterae.AAC.2
MRTSGDALPGAGNTPRLQATATRPRELQPLYLVRTERTPLPRARRYSPRCRGNDRSRTSITRRHPQHRNARKVALCSSYVTQKRECQALAREVQHARRTLACARPFSASALLAQASRRTRVWKERLFVGICAIERAWLLHASDLAKRRARRC